jgi:hypothetical protein
MKLWMAAPAVALVLGTGTGTAMADANSMLTVAVGTGMSITRSKDLDSSAWQSAVAPELNLRLKMFKVLALELGFTPGREAPTDVELCYDSTYRMSALLYLVPLDSFGLYAKLGFGGDRISDMVSVTSPSNSYHGGGGVDVYLWDHLAVGAEFLLLTPGITAVEDAILRRVLTVAGGEDAPKKSLDELSMTDFVSGDNFRTTLSLRYFF